MSITESSNEQRDVFLSHRSVDKPFVRKLATDIEATTYGDRCLTTWLDEGEIRPGQSVPGMVNHGLEHSRFIALVMTSAYFSSESGWTDAEWHAALNTDPDNRRGRLIPIIAGDCPYVPMILRHLLSLDLRGRNYATDFRRLVSVLRDETFPRPFTHRGQLIRSNGQIDRATLVAERAVPDGDPDPIEENLSCNLLPVERMPMYLYEAPMHGNLRGKRNDGSERLSTKSQLKKVILSTQIDAGVENPRMPAFRVVGDRILSFHDLEAEESLLSPIVDQKEVVPIRVNEAIQDEDDRRILVSLLNMSLVRHLIRRGLRVDDKRGNRFYFPPDSGKAREVTWRPFRNQTTRTVTKPYNQGDHILHWLHQAAYLKVVFLASRFFLQITPTWLLTEDGETVKGGPEVARVVNRWVGRERNLNVLYHIRFWTWILRRGPGSISVPVGEQTIDVATIPAFVTQSYGIESDQKNILEALDEVAQQIALEEEGLEVEINGDGEEEVKEFDEVIDEQTEGDE